MINENTDLVELFNPESTVACLQFNLVLIVFLTSHSLHTKGHAGSEKKNLNFTLNFYFQNAPIWIKILCNDFIKCGHKFHKGPISTSSEGNSYIMVLVDAFTQIL